MDALTLFGLFAVLAMLVCYALESRSHWFVLLFAGSCSLGSAYGFLQEAWPFGLVRSDLVSSRPPGDGSGWDTIDRALTVVGMARRNLGALLLG